MVKFLLNKPIAVTMTFIAIMIVGLVSVTKIPVSLMPDIAIPEITVQVSSENTPARELENSIVRPLRQQLMQVAHLDDINSETSDGNSVIRLKFAYGTDINYAFIEVNEKVDRAMGYMPKEMQRPKVIKANVSDVPVFYLNLTLKDSKFQVPGSKFNKEQPESEHSGDWRSQTWNQEPVNEQQFVELSRFATNVIRKRLEQLPEVAMADISGMVNNEIMIVADEEKLDALQLTLDRIESIIASNNIQLGNLSIKDGQYIYNIRFESAIRDKHDIENIYFKVDDRLLQLKDIAQVIEQPQKLRGKVISNNGETVTMAVIKQSDAQMKQLKESLHGLIAHFETDYPDIQFEIVRDQTKLLDYSINNLKNSLLLGALLAFFVMFIFMRDTRSPMLIGISVPVALVLSLLFFHLLDISINIISLSGLILGVGMMVDNSIIVIDNIAQHFERNSMLRQAQHPKSKIQNPNSKLSNEQPETWNLKPEINNLKLLKESCTSGTNEVIRPLLSSVLTTCAVFIPLIFIKGITGALFYDQAMAITIGLFASLAVSITILPVYYLLFFREGKVNKVDKWMQKFSSIDYDKLYERGFRFTLRNQKTVWGIVLLTLVASFALYKALPTGKLPPMDKDEMLVHIDWNGRINIEENEARLKLVVQGLDGYIENYTGLIGEQQFLMNKSETGGQAEAVLYLKLKSPTVIDTVKTMAGKLVHEISSRASYSVSDADNIFNVVFSDNEQPLVARLRATNDYREQYKHHLKETHQMLTDSLNLRLSPIVWQEQTVLVASSEKLLLYNVPYNQLYNKLKTMFSQNQIAVITDNNEFIPVVMGGIPRNLDQVISETTIKNSNGEHIPVRELFSRQPGYDLKTILAGREGEYYSINLPLGNKKPENMMGKVRQLLKNDNLFEAGFTGSYFSNREMVKQLVIILLISLSLLFFILAAQFESLSLPIIVLLEVPIDISGALLFLWMFGSSINLMSLIGIVVMSGIIINDSILKIDTINQLRKEGYSTLRALSVAGKRRLKPILMTSITTILALTPFLLTGGTGSDLQRPLALAIIGGMLVGTLVSLYFIPLSYYYLKRN
jgi:multidrug efflux pump subunit AcrB